ncbi:MAG: glycosyltransferase family 2 protein [Candidatus Deferrimicrobiaceae bacterium]
MGGPSPGAPVFSVIVLNWNGRHLLEECLESVRSQSFRDFEMIVVDNGSTDGSVSLLQERWGGKMELIFLASNMGFAGGNNAGIRKAKGKYVILLNNDTEVDPDWLLAVHRAISRHPEAGMFTPKILNYYCRDEIDNTGHLIYPDGLARGHNRLEKNDGRFDEEREALYPSGCAGVYKKEMLDGIGLLDETFFAYGEDVDLGLRARWAGWKCFYVPDAVVYHKYSATTGTYSSRKAFLVERNRLWILFGNFPLKDILVSPFYTAHRYAMHFLGAVSGRGASGKFTKEHSLWRLIVTILRAEFAAFFGIPRVLRQRMANRRNRRITVAQFRLLLRRFAMSAEEIALKD